MQMESPERLTVLLKSNDKQEQVVTKITRILRNLGVESQSYRIYVDSGERTVIHIVLESKIADDFIFEALNQQISFVATNSKVRRILDILSMDYHEFINDDKTQKKKYNKLNEDDEEYEDFDFDEFDNSSLKMGKILSLNDPNEIIKNVAELKRDGEKIIERTSSILRHTVEIEIEKQVNSSEDDTEQYEKALKRLHDIMNEKLFSRKELTDLTYKAGLGFISLVKNNNKYSKQLKEIMENENMDEFIRVKSAIVLIENLRKSHYSRREILSMIDLKKIEHAINSQKDNFDPSELQQITSLLS